MKRRAVPPGLEVLLKKARVDADFRGRLEANPEAAATYIGLKLTDVERSILANVPGEKLESIIDKTDVPRQHVRTFLTRSATAMLTVVLSTTVAVDIFAAGIVEDSYMESDEFFVEDLGFIQAILEAYRSEYGRYPTTEEWYLCENPFRDFVGMYAGVDSDQLRDYEGDRYRYRGESTDGIPMNYQLGSANDEHVVGPDDPEMHRFVGPNRIAITDPPRIYGQSTRIDLPLEEGETAAALPLRVWHDDPAATVSWYWDRTSLGSTRTVHEILPVIVPGTFELFVVDENGYSDFLEVRVVRVKETTGLEAGDPKEAQESPAVQE